MWGSLVALIKRDVALARGQGGALGAALGFILAVIVLIPLAVGPEQALLSRLAPGIIWLSLLLSVLLTAERIFQQDYEDGSLDVMMMARVPFEMITLTKAIAHWLTVSLPLSVIAPPLGFLLNINVLQLPMLWASMIMGSLALSLLASIGGAVTAGLRRGGLLVSLLILPLYVPILIFGISISVAPERSIAAFTLLGALTLVSAVVAPWASAAALRAYLR